MATWIIGGILLVLLLIAAKHIVANFSGGKCSGCPGGCGGSCACQAKKPPQEQAAGDSL